jgi:hypothetical protein
MALLRKDYGEGVVDFEADLSDIQMDYVTVYIIMPAKRTVEKLVSIVPMRLGPGRWRMEFLFNSAETCGASTVHEERKRALIRKAMDNFSAHMMAFLQALEE